MFVSGKLDPSPASSQSENISYFPACYTRGVEKNSDENGFMKLNVKFTQFLKHSPDVFDQPGHVRNQNVASLIKHLSYC